MKAALATAKADTEAPLRTCEPHVSDDCDHGNLPLSPACHGVYFHGADGDGDGGRERERERGLTAD
eukprot:11597163-Alexandrium_andersonii.AAC.1